MEFGKIGIMTGDDLNALPWLNNTISLIRLVMGVLVPYLIHVVNVSLRKVFMALLVNLHSHHRETVQPQCL